MRAELRSLHSPDASTGLETYAPEDERSFRVLVEATIGSEGSPAADVLRFLVVGPDWFAENLPGKGFRWGRHHLVVDRWDYDTVHRAIADVCLHAEGLDWNEVAGKLASFGDWEFDGFGPAAN
jgi:hypothetical protein